MEKIAIVILAFMILIPNPGISQQEQGTLHVQGTSILRAKPDEAVARFSYEIIRMDYKTAVQDLGREADQLKKTLGHEGLNAEDLKTVLFNVGINRIYVKGQQKDSGYVARQILEIKFPYESQELISLMNRISRSKTDPDITFSFQLSENEMKKVKSELIKQAVQDAASKAGVIAEASGTAVSGVVEIKYGEFSGPEPPMYRMMEARTADEPSYGGFNVEELTFTESIEITYSIR